jgi:protein NirF
MGRLLTLLSMVLLAAAPRRNAWYRRPWAGHRACERADQPGRYQPTRKPYARIGGLGDLSHASVVYSRDGRYAYVFGRDGGLTKVDLLEARIVKRVLQSGNAIGGAISQDGRIVVAQNYTPGGIKAFDAETLELLSEVPAEYAPGSFSKVVGLADLSGNRFAYALFDGGEIWVSDFSDPRHPADAALSGRAAAL